MLCLCGANVYRELAYRGNETLGFMTCARLTSDHPIMTASDLWTFCECLFIPYKQGEFCSYYPKIVYRYFTLDLNIEVVSPMYSTTRLWPCDY
ncbi:Phospho-2-dehydro-3-deoxyheptonate aldolase 2, chloroplastic [Trifolium repens]|nr:Phospho-2-dehydro-3-deoxyheptonate aldolase 2, chloroplastic [Trifolium repens]